MDDLARRRTPEGIPQIEISCPCCGNGLSIAATEAVTAAIAGQGSTPTAIGPSDGDIDAQVMRLVAGGLTDRAIAAELRLPLHRVKRSVRDWMIRLDADNRTAAAVRATKLGLME